MFLDVTHLPEVREFLANMLKSMSIILAISGYDPSATDEAVNFSSLISEMILSKLDKKDFIIFPNSV